MNAVGDLFFTEFKKIDLETKLSANKYEDLITKVSIIYMCKYDMTKRKDR